MKKNSTSFFLCLPIFLLLALSFSTSAFSLDVDLRQGRWFGNAVCYSGYRHGQNPDSGQYPSQSQIFEDLKILESHWRLIRVYSSNQHTRDILEVIRRERINIKVMLGAYLKGEPGNEAINGQEVRESIRLANEYRDIVIAVSVGNEILIHWSDHKVPEDRVIQYVQEVKRNVSVPVTVDDDIFYWRDRGARLASVVDFVTIHTYPIWGGVDINRGLEVTIQHFESLKAVLPPGKTIVIGEAGWASYTAGDAHAQGAGNEWNQKRYFDELSSWAARSGVNVFMFEAFDEPWKGEGTEGHWGLFTADRKPKLVVADRHRW
ncbi:MAG: glycosyl hydrolase [Oligoflexia bacterium]|nr:glycosyl hydrolase [Oligoflexia bacterium]